MENQEEQTNEMSIEQVNEEKAVTINQDKLNQYVEKLKLNQNLTFGFVCGLAAAIVGALLWAVITVSTQYQVGYMAVAVGLLVGYAIKISGKGIDKIFGIMGASLALFGCLLGNLLGIVGFIANDLGVGYSAALSIINFSTIPALMKESFGPIDLLFYGLAIYEGYKFSFRQMTEQEIVDNAAE